MSNSIIIGEGDWIRIPNDTDAIKELEASYRFSNQWADVVANAAAEKFFQVKQREYPMSHKQMRDEIRYHYYLYQMGIFRDHTDVTDLDPNEGGFFQDAMNVLSGIGF